MYRIFILMFCIFALFLGGGGRASLLAQMVKNLLAMQETWIQPQGWEDPQRRKWLLTPIFLPGEFYGQRIQSMGSQRVRHVWVTKTLSWTTSRTANDEDESIDINWRIAWGLIFWSVWRVVDTCLTEISDPGEM